jgi:hypothetical protein
VGAARHVLPGLERTWSTHSRSGVRHIIGGAIEAGNGTERQRLSGEGATIAACWAVVYAMRFQPFQTEIQERCLMTDGLPTLRRGKAKRIGMTPCLDATTRRLAEATLA